MACRKLQNADNAPALSPTGSSKPHTSFLDFPAELRNEVYALTLDLRGTNPTIRLKRDWSGQIYIFSVSPSPDYGNKCNILAVNRQINAEATPILYGLHHFTTQSFDVLEGFLEQIGSSRKYLRSVTCEAIGYGLASASCFGLLSSSLQLQKIQLAIPRLNHASREQVLDDLTSRLLPLMQSLYQSRGPEVLKILELWTFLPRGDEKKGCCPVVTDEVIQRLEQAVGDQRHGSPI